MARIIIDLKLFCLLSFGFFLFTIIGTVSHEGGHYAVAKYFGYSAHIGYGYTSWENVEDQRILDSTYALYAKYINENKAYPGIDKFQTIEKKQYHDGFWITLGGPLQTICTGTIAFIFLLFQRKKVLAAHKLNFFQWLLVFLSLFWLRQSANLVSWIVVYLIKGNFSERGDEIGLAEEMHLPKGMLVISTAIIGFAVLSFIIFEILPKKYRLTFSLAGLAGGIFGFYFWLFLAGPHIMP